MTTIDYYSETKVTMPVAIAEWGIDGLSVAPLGSTVDTGCKPLLEVNGEAVDVRATGATDDVLSRGAMALTQCDGSDVSVAKGEVRVGTAVGKDAGVDLDRVLLRSAPGGGAVERRLCGAGCVEHATSSHGGERRPRSRTSCRSTERARRSGSFSARARTTVGRRP